MPMMTDALQPQVTNTYQDTVYFIPGFMGSNLLVDGKPVWLDMSALGWGEFTSLKMAQTNVVTGGVLETAYRPLLTFLQKSHQVVEFAYDWRQSALVTGALLGEALVRELDRAKAENSPLRLRILAHASGGLVVLGMMAALPDVWERLQAEADCRCVLLGTPLQGTYTAVQMLRGEHRLIHLMNIAAGQADAAERGKKNKLLASQFASYPGLLEQVPATYLNGNAWQALLEEDFSEWPGLALLSAAEQVRERLDSVILSAQNLCYVYGKARLTPTVLEQDDNNRWRFRAVAGGDGVTLWESLKLQTASQWFMPVEHGYMASDPAYFSGLIELLDMGKSGQLWQPPLPTIDQPAQWLPDPPINLYPDVNELQAAALGYHTRMTQQEVRPLIDVGVVHGDMEHVPFPVVVGHYEGDAILSTEAVLDGCLNGALSGRLRMGSYPGPLKTYEIFFNSGKRPGGAVVVGLDDVGKLTPRKLTMTFAAAMMRYALAVGERSNKSTIAHIATGSDFLPVHVATLLLGTSVNGGLGLTDCIVALLRGIVQANQMLEKNEYGEYVRLNSIEFIELYEDRAVEATHLVRSILKYPEFRYEFSAPEFMRLLPGSRRRVIYQESTGWWRRLQVIADGNGLKYTMLTDRARAEILLQDTQVSLVDQFIKKAVSSSKVDFELSKSLFALLFPDEIQSQIPDVGNMLLVLDEQTAEYPWELLYDRHNEEGKPLSVHAGILRQLMVGQYKKPKRSAIERSALVIGNPPTEMPFPPLPAAEEEANSIVGMLNKTGKFTQIVERIGKSPESTIQAVLNEDYRILHLAGHGVFNYKPDKKTKAITGMVLGGGIFLTANEIEKMDCVPDFVFINCCHLGRIDDSINQANNHDSLDENNVPDDSMLLDDRSRLAASLAKSLIEMGVRIIIAAGWAINDKAAKTFSTVCYEKLLAGEAFGKSVLAAREETWKKHGDTNTWGAYQCYGDPEYRLFEPKQDQDSDSGDGCDSQTHAVRTFVAEIEVVTELHNLVNAADTSQKSEYPELEKRLMSLHDAIPALWSDHAAVLYELGRAYGKLEMYQQALAAYQAAIDSADTTYPLSLLEDKVGLQTAWALACAQQRMAAPDGEPVDTFIDRMMADSLKTLNALEDLGNSLQRMEEVGKYWKRKAMIDAIIGQDEERTASALEAMAKAYKKAHEFALSATGEIAGYPLINWLTGKVVRYLRGNSKQLERQEIKQYLEQIRANVDAAEKNSPNFLTGITFAEYALLEYLTSARLEEASKMQRVTTYYEEAVSRGTAPRKIRYVSEHLTFLRLMLDGHQTDKQQLQPVVDALRDIEGRLVV
jgi:tetratricopeptide (TPR) repeat protein